MSVFVFDGWLDLCMTASVRRMFHLVSISPPFSSPCHCLSIGYGCFCALHAESLLVFFVSMTGYVQNSRGKNSPSILLIRYTFLFSSYHHCLSDEKRTLRSFVFRRQSFIYRISGYMTSTRLPYHLLYILSLYQSLTLYLIWNIGLSRAFGLPESSRSLLTRFIPIVLDTRYSPRICHFSPHWSHFPAATSFSGSECGEFMVFSRFHFSNSPLNSDPLR